jgi:cysteine desulfurase/selenocysteine lyase
VSSAPAAVLGDRSQFPELKAIAYCNHAAVSPLSKPVVQAVHDIVADYAREGLGAFFPWHLRREGLRERCARLIGADADEIALSAGTTRGISDIALSLPWRAGQRIVLFGGEFPTNVTPWQCAARAFGLDIVWLRADDFATERGLEQLRAALREGVRLVAVSAVQFQSGLQMPIEQMGKLCRQYGCELFVDAIQALGVVPFDVRRCHVDYLSSGSHKWLMGVEGAGLLYVRRECAAALEPRAAGWLSHEEPDGFLRLGAGHLRYDRPLKRSARVFEASAPNVLGCAALDASLELLLGLGVESIHAHVQRYHDALEPALVARGFTSRRSALASQRSGTLSVQVPAQVDAVALHQALVRADVSCALPDGLLRFAPHWPNSLSEVPLILERVDAALSAQRR